MLKSEKQHSNTAHLLPLRHAMSKKDTYEKVFACEGDAGIQVEAEAGSRRHHLVIIFLLTEGLQYTDSAFFGCVQNCSAVAITAIMGLASTRLHTAVQFVRYDALHGMPNFPVQSKERKSPPLRPFLRVLRHSVNDFSLLAVVTWGSLASG